MEKLVQGMASLLRISASEIEEKGTTEEGINELLDKAKSLKVYNQDELADYRANVESAYKDGAYGDVRKTVLETEERKLKQKYDRNDLKQGEHYQTKEELYDLIINDKIKTSKSGNDDSELKKEIEALRRLNETKSQEWETEKNSLITDYSSKLSSGLLNGQLDRLVDKLDIEDSAKGNQKEYLQYLFNQKYSIESTSEGTIIKDKLTDSPIRDENVALINPAAFFAKFAEEKGLKIKQTASVQGRGIKDDPKNVNKSVVVKGTDMAKYSSFDEFLQSDKGKGLVAGSKESMEYFNAFSESRTMA